MATYDQLLQMLTSQLGSRNLFGSDPSSGRFSGYYGTNQNAMYSPYGDMANMNPESFLQGLFSGTVNPYGYTAGQQNAMPMFDYIPGVGFASGSADPNQWSRSPDQVSQMLQQFGFGGGPAVSGGAAPGMEEFMRQRAEAYASQQGQPAPTQGATPQLPGDTNYTPSLIDPSNPPGNAPGEEGPINWDPNPGGGSDVPYESPPGDHPGYPQPPWGGGGGPGAIGGPPPWYPTQPYPGPTQPPPSGTNPNGPYTGTGGQQNESAGMNPYDFSRYLGQFPGPHVGPGTPGADYEEGQHAWRQAQDYNWETEAFHNRLYAANMERNNIWGHLNPNPNIAGGLDQFYSNAMPSATQNYNESLWGLSGRQGFSPNMDRTNYGLDYVMQTAPEGFGWWAKGAANNQEMDFARWVMNNNPMELLNSGQITPEQLSTAIQASNSGMGQVNQGLYDMVGAGRPEYGQDLSGLIPSYQQVMQTMTAGPGGMGGGFMDAMTKSFQEGLPGSEQTNAYSQQNQDIFNQLVNNPSGYSAYDAMNAILGPEGIANAVGSERAGTSGVTDMTSNILGNVTDLWGNTENGGPVGWLQDMFRHGPPGQQADISDRGGIEGLQGELTNLGRSGMGGAIGAAQEQMQRGGLTDEYVSAMMNQVLEPSQRQLTEKLNSMAGGRANLGTSGTSQFAMEQLQQDFNDSLIRSGLDNYQNALGTLGQLGGQAGGQAVDTYRTIMDTALKPIQASGDLTSQIGNLALGGFNAPADQSMKAMQLAHQMGMDVQGMGTQQANQQARNQLDLMGLGMQGALGYGDQMVDVARYGAGREHTADQQYLANLLGAEKGYLDPAAQGASMQDRMSNWMLQTAGLGQNQEQLRMDALNRMLMGGQNLLGSNQRFGLGVSQQDTNLMQALLGYQQQNDLMNPGFGWGEALQLFAQMAAAASSIRFKDDVQDLKSNRIDKLRPVTYRYKQQIDPKQTKRIGLIAEEVAEIYPDLVEIGADGKPTAIRYMELVPILIGEVQSLRERLHKLEDK